MSVVDPDAVAESESLGRMLTAWWRYAELRSRGAPLPERLAAWSALQEERRRHRAAPHR